MIKLILAIRNHYSASIAMLPTTKFYLAERFLCLILFAVSVFFLNSCQEIGQKKEAVPDQQSTEKAPTMQIAKLSQGDDAALESIRTAFVKANPGYDLAFQKNIEEITAKAYDRIIFVQEGDPDLNLSSGLKSKTTVGDIIILDAGESLTADSLMSVLEFKVPETPADTIPRLIRPDWDMNITDVAGGCATEKNAYRRILLTWKQEVGQYLYHALNAHRVRIMDSFSHYHPVKGGFDEFYLVQMALPEARIITSSKVSSIENPENVTKESAADLLSSTSLDVGDFVYLPRGTMHRGVGGVLAQVITVPGFIPGSEVGVDHHLKAINEKLSLNETEALPYNQEASKSAIVK